MIFRNFEELVVAPRIIIDHPHDNIYSSLKNSALIATIVFAVLCIFSIIPIHALILCFGIYLVISFIDRFVINKINDYQSQKALRSAQVSTISVVKYSEYYGIIVFSRKTSSQTSSQTILDIAQKLRTYDVIEESDNPAIRHIQDRLWNYKDGFEAERLPVEIVGEKGIWWKMETMPNRLPNNFNITTDFLVGFITKKKKKTDIKPVTKDFYETYLG